MIYPHLARLVRLSPVAADAAFLRVGDDLALRDPAGRWSIAVRGGVIRFAGPGTPLEPPRPHLTWPVRCAPGVLALRWRRIAIALEITPWSEMHTEVAIRAVGRRATTADARPYIDAVSSALDLLVSEMRSWADGALFLDAVGSPSGS
jgi:hypothetical protein